MNHGIITELLKAIRNRSRNASKTDEDKGKSIRRANAGSNTMSRMDETVHPINPGTDTIYNIYLGVQKTYDEHDIKGLTKIYTDFIIYSRLILIY